MILDMGIEIIPMEVKHIDPRTATGVVLHAAITTEPKEVDAVLHHAMITMCQEAVVVIIVLEVVRLVVGRAAQHAEVEIM